MPSRYLPLLSLMLIGCSPAPRTVDPLPGGPDVPARISPDAEHVDVPAPDTVIEEDSAALQCADFGAACTSNADCECGWCVEGPSGHVCTQPCVEECPFGYLCKQAGATGQDIVFLCVPIQQKLCEPCLSDEQCHGGTCAELGDEGTFCTAPCGEGGECPAGYQCLAEAGAEGSQCWPEIASCTCTPETQGDQRTCWASNEEGTCPGWEACDPDAGWVGCNAKTPSGEVCDGSDNDCDGLADEDLEAPVCDQQEGVCAGSVKLCIGSSGWLACGSTSLGQTWEPTEVSCDALDNDCDGATDEDLSQPCSLVLGVCAGVKNTCAAGAFGGCDYGSAWEADEALCDGLDNDCNGLTDDVDTDGDGFASVACGGTDCDDTDPAVHPAMAEDCATPADDDCSGEANDLDADGDGFVAMACGGPDCEDTHPLANPDGVELCGDGVDNDCSGAAEDKDADGDGFVDAACGGDDCNDGSGLAKPGEVEVCGDGLDNDCDGGIDNKDLDGDSFTDPACGGLDCDDDEEQVGPGEPEICDDLDNDCNGLTDDKDADSDGVLDALCPGGSDCDDDDPFVQPGLDEICGDPDGKDEDCSGEVDDRDIDGDGFVDAAPACGGDDCDDLDPLVWPAADEIYDTKDTDCDGVVDEGLVEPGTVIVTELLVNPSGIDDKDGEWIELTNLGVLPVNLASWTMADEATAVQNAWVFPAQVPILVGPGQSVVLCLNGDPAQNGGIDCDATYSGFFQGNAGDEVILTLGTEEIDRVEFGTSSEGWPNQSGPSMSLDPNQYTAAGNDDPGNWCAAPEGLGSPGSINPSCTGATVVTSVVPSAGVDDGGDALVLSGTGFIGAEAATIGGNFCQDFSVVDDHTITCVAPPGTAGDADVAVVKGGEAAVLGAGYRYTGEAVVAIDYCSLMWPAALEAAAGDPTALSYGQVHSPGLTSAAGPPAGVLAEIGFGPAGSDPRGEPGWAWTQAVWHLQFFANDEFRQTLVVDAPGSYSYGWRFSDDGGFNYMYCDFDPGTADGFKVEDLGTLTVL